MNIQLYPSKKIIIPNDRISKVVFDLTIDEYKAIVKRQSELQVTEMRKSKSKRSDDIITPIMIKLEEAELRVSEPLDQFDCAVLSVCIAEWEEGNRHTTPAIIYRGLTGKVDKGTDAMPHVDQLTAINHSIEKLMRVQLDIRLVDVCRYLGYNNGKPKKVLANILPCKRVDFTINGQEATTIELLAESPLFTVAKLKNNQIVSYDAKLLDMPGQQNTPKLIAVKHYVMKRVMEIIGHPKQMTASITFADVFKKCRIEDADNKTKQRVRNFIVEVFKHLLDCKVIKSYEVNKKGTGFHSVSFTFKRRVGRH